MRKSIKLSLVAGALLTSVSLFVGCGGGGGGSASTTTGPVVDAYLVKLPSPAYDSKNPENKSSVVVFKNNKTTGEIKFNTSVEGNVIIPAGAIYDSDGNGKYDSDDKNLSFPLIGKANQPITPLSTYEVVTGKNLKSLSGVDPIANLKDDPTAYLLGQVIVKAMKLANTSDTSKLKDINITVNKGIPNVTIEGNLSKTIKSKGIDPSSITAIVKPEVIVATKVALNNGVLKSQDLIKSAEIEHNIAKQVKQVIESNSSLIGKVEEEAKRYGIDNPTSVMDSLNVVANAEQDVADLVKEETQNVTTSGSTEKQDITTPSTSGSTKNSTNQEKVGSLKDNQPQQNVEQTPKDQIESNPSNNSNSSNLDNPPFPSMGSRYIWIGKDRVALDNGNFNTVNKNRSDDVEDIWNISFKIDNKNLDNFNIGVKILKESTGATGDIVFSGLSIKNGVINSPKKIDIYGIKSNGDEGGTHFDSGYNPDNILSKSISLDGDILTIKFGTVIKQQDVVSVNSFKAISRYKIQIDSDKLNIIGAKIFSNKESIHYTTGDSFNKKSEIMGYIKIN